MLKKVASRKRRERGGRRTKGNDGEKTSAPASCVRRHRKENVPEEGGGKNSGENKVL